MKIKALKCLKYLCFKSEVNFRRDLQKNAQVVRNLQMYKGTDDALKGDADNKKVRELAKEVVKLIYEGPAADPNAGNLGSTPAQASYSGESFILPCDNPSCIEVCLISLCRVR